MTLPVGSWSEKDRSVLNRYPQAVAHMWRQVESGRFGLIIGAGVSAPFGLPTWPHLVERIAEHPRIAAEGLKREISVTPLPILTQILLHHYRQRLVDGEPPQARNERDLSRLVAANFRDIMHECLYRDVPQSEEELEERDDFYRHYVDVIRRSPLTVVYNFDDTLERLLLLKRSEDDLKKGSRGFEVVTDGRQQFRRREAVIYHPNGFLPFNLMEGRSEAVVFNEEALEDQLIGSMVGEYSTLLHHLSKSTFLFVGLSLDDATLRHILRQSARINPGHFHYYVSFVESMPDGLTEAQVSRAAANFEVFNLITVYLDAGGIGSLGRLLSSDSEEIRSLAEEENVRLNYCFYLTGVPGVGKTTTFSYFKNLVTTDEWASERLPAMGRPWTELSDTEKAEVDRFVLDQWNLKNRALLNDAENPGIGITLVDRCLPDALAFTDSLEWQAKAVALLKAISPRQAHRRVHPGHIIMLYGDPPELVVRARCAGKTSEQGYVETLQEDTAKVYNGTGVEVLDTRNMSIAEVVRSVADIIHRQTYEECDIHALLEGFCAAGYPKAELVDC
jgi:hypothetical protein